VLRDLGRASRELYRELAALDGLECGFTPAGVLQVLKTRAAFEAAVEEAHLLRRYGLAAEAWDADRVRQREPNLRPGVVGGVYYPDDAHLDPAAFVRGLARLAEQKGACLHTQTEVLGFETAGRSVSRVVTTRGDFRAEQVVIAAGSWSPGLARQLDLNLPIQAAKGYSLTLNRPPACPTLPLLLGEARVAVTPLDGTLRLAGTLELAGMDFSINRRRVSAIRRAAGEYLRGMDGLEPGEVWCGLRPCTPDGLPLIGRSEAFDNLIIAAGHAMVGMSLGPITGKLVAQLAGREPPAIDLTALRPGRFH
jgi:D-amino-acid dehydrogenase